MGEAKRKRTTRSRKEKTDGIVDKLINSQVGSTTSKLSEVIRSQADTLEQSEIPPHLNVWANMHTAWENLAQDFFADLPKKQREDAKFIFFHGVQAAGNLCIYCAGQGMFEAAADQITKDCVVYEKEAEGVLAERKADRDPRSTVPPDVVN